MIKRFVFLVILILLGTTNSLQGQDLKKVKERIKEPYFHILEYEVLKSDKGIKQGKYQKIRGKKRIVETGQYHNNKRVGIWTNYDHTGEIHYKYDWDKDQVVYVTPKLNEEKQIILNDNKEESWIVDNPIIFKDGIDQFQIGIFTRIKYPKDAIEKGISGIVKIEWIVDEKGAVKDIKVRNGLYPSIDNEALRVVKEQIEKTEFIPAMLKGEYLEAKYIHSVRFKLE